MFDRFYELDLTVLYPAILILIAGAAELGAGIGWRSRGAATQDAVIAAAAASALALLALLLGFSFSLALSRYDLCRTMVLDEANAIGSTANFALMLPEPAQRPILGLLRDYAVVRIGLDVPFNPSKLDRDIARSLDLQTRLWHEAMAVTAAAPQSLPGLPLRRLAERDEEYPTKGASPPCATTCPAR